MFHTCFNGCICVKQSINVGILFFHNRATKFTWKHHHFYENAPGLEGPFNPFLYHHQRCLNNPIFLIWGYVLHVEHISCVIMNCGQYLRHPFSIDTGIRGEFVPIFEHAFHNFALKIALLILGYPCYLFLLSSGWVIIALCGSIYPPWELNQHCLR